MNRDKTLRERRRSKGKSSTKKGAAKGPKAQEALTHVSCSSPNEDQQQPSPPSYQPFEDVFDFSESAVKDRDAPFLEFLKVQPGQEGACCVNMLARLDCVIPALKLTGCDIGYPEGKKQIQQKEQLVLALDYLNGFKQTYASRYTTLQWFFTSSAEKIIYTNALTTAVRLQKTFNDGWKVWRDKKNAADKENRH